MLDSMSAKARGAGEGAIRRRVPRVHGYGSIYGGSSVSTFRRLIHGRVDPADHRQLQQEAAARGISMTACVGDIIREYFALRVEMASAVALPGKPGERHTGLIHSILARTEERLAATLDARAAELGDQLQRIEIMLDRLVRVYLLHTPEVPLELRDGAVASGNRRYGLYRKFVNERLAQVGSAAPAAAAVDASMRTEKET
jgi:hypothetical protein